MKRQSFLRPTISKRSLRTSLIVLLTTVCTITVPVPVRAATIYRSGTITVDETWTSDNLYVINGNLVVSWGATLTIQAGTVVKFSGSTRLMQIDGELDVQGTSSDPVVFTSYKEMGGCG